MSVIGGEKSNNVADNVHTLKLLCSVNLFDSVFLLSCFLFNNLAYTRYILPKRPSDEECIEYHKITLTIYSLGKKCKNHAECFHTELPPRIMNWGPSNLKDVERGSIQRDRYHIFLKFLLYSNCITPSYRTVVENEKNVHFFKFQIP